MLSFQFPCTASSIFQGIPSYSSFHPRDNILISSASSAHFGVPIVTLIVRCLLFEHPAIEAQNITKQTSGDIVAHFRVTTHSLRMRSDAVYTLYSDTCSDNEHRKPCVAVPYGAWYKISHNAQIILSRNYFWFRDTKFYHFVPWVPPPPPALPNKRKIFLKKTSRLYLKISWWHLSTHIVIRPRKHRVPLLARFSV